MLFVVCRAAMVVQVIVPVPEYTAKCHIMVTTGKAKYDATKKAIVSHMGGWLLDGGLLGAHVLCRHHGTTTCKIQILG